MHWKLTVLGEVAAFIFFFSGFYNAFLPLLATLTHSTVSMEGAMVVTLGCTSNIYLLLFISVTLGGGN